MTEATYLRVMPQYANFCSNYGAAVAQINQKTPDPKVRYSRLKELYRIFEERRAAILAPFGLTVEEYEMDATLYER